MWRSGSLKNLAVLMLVFGAVAFGPARALGLDVLVVDTDLYKGGEAVRRVRTMTQILAPGSEVDIIHYRKLTPGRIASRAPRAIIVAPTRQSLQRYQKKPLARAMEAIRSFRGPVLGIGGGHQFVALAYGGKVADMGTEKGEQGLTQLRILGPDPLFDGIPTEFVAWEGHKEHVSELPEGFKVLVESDTCRVQAMRHATRPIYGVQFHPEAPQGARLPARALLSNFLKLARVLRD